MDTKFIFSFRYIFALLKGTPTNLERLGIIETFIVSCSVKIVTFYY